MISQNFGKIRSANTLTRPWQVIAAAAIMATLADAWLFKPGGAASNPNFRLMLLQDWRIFAVVWVSSYGLVALVLTTASVIVDVSRVRGYVERLAAQGVITHTALTDALLSTGWPICFGRQNSRERPETAVTAWPRPGNNPRPVRQVCALYLERLAITQYFTALVVLLGIAISSVPVGSATPSFFPALTKEASDFSASSTLVLSGVLGLLSLMVAIPRFARLGSEPIVENPNLGPVSTVLEPPEMHLQAGQPNMVLAQLNTALELCQQPVIDAITALTTAVDRLTSGLRSEIRAGLQDTPRLQPSNIETASISAIDAATTELRNIATVLNTSVTSLAEATALFSAMDTDPSPSHSAARPAGRVSDLAIELEKLLAEIGPPVAGEQEPLK